MVSEKNQKLQNFNQQNDGECLLGRGRLMLCKLIALDRTIDIDIYSETLINIVTHPPYNLDIAISDYHLSPELIKHLGEAHFKIGQREAFY